MPRFPSLRLVAALLISDDGKIQCGNVCSASYESGDVVTLTANPDQQWGFAGWTGS